MKSLRQARELFEVGTSWWLSELREMAEQIGSAFNLKRMRTARITVEANVVRLELRPFRSGDRAGRQIPRPEHQDELVRVIHRLATSVQPLRAVEVFLPPAAILSREVRLPIAVRREIHKAMEFQVERWMPLRKELIYFDAPILRLDLTRQEVIVNLTITRRDLVDAILESLTADTPATISVMALQKQDAAAVPFLFARRQAPAIQQSRRITQRLWMAAAGLAVAAFVTVVVQQIRVNQELDTQLDETATVARKASQLETSLDDRMRRIRFLVQEAAKPDTAAILAALTAQLPDDCWIYQFQLEGSQLRINGVAKNASSVVEALNQSPLFADVALQTAIKNSTPDSERFDIALRVKAPTP